MFRVNVISGFESGHFLRGYKGKCENIHGHNYKVEISLLSDNLDDTGLLIDFKDLHKALDGVLKELDHKLINDNDYFKETNPSSENLAKYIYNEMKKELVLSDNAKIEKVRVWENEKQWAEYFE